MPTYMPLLAVVDGSTWTFPSDQTGFKAGHHRLDSRQSDNVRATSLSCRREGRHIPNANDWASQRSLVPFFSPTNLPRCTQTVTNGRVPHSNLDVIPRTVSTSGWGAGTCHDTTSGPDRRQPSMIFSFQPIPRGFNKHHHPTAPPLLPTTKPLKTPRPVGSPSHSTSPPTLTSPPPPLPRTATRHWGNTTRDGSKHIPNPVGSVGQTERKPSSRPKKETPLEEEKFSVYACMHPRLEK